MRVEISYQQPTDQFAITIDQQLQTIPGPYFDDVTKIGSLSAGQANTSALLYLQLNLPMAMTIAAARSRQDALTTKHDREGRDGRRWFLSQVMFEFIDRLHAPRWQDLPPNQKIQLLFQFIRAHQITCVFGDNGT